MRLIAKTLLAATAVAGFSGAAMAADLYVPPAAPVVAVAAPTSWDGPYIGANVGYSWAESDVTGTTPVFDINNGEYTSNAALSGFELGAQAGYLFHLSDNIVGGIEGSLDWSNQTGDATTYYFGDPSNDVTGITQSINWEGMITAKLGVDVGGNILPYVDAGVAFANITRDATDQDPDFGTTPTSATNTQVGWTVGVGVEAMLADHLSAFVSYNYADYGHSDFDTGGDYVPSVHTTDNIVKAGLNFHF